MRRRDFIKVISGSAVAWPLAARAQQSPLPVVGFLYAGSPEPSTNLVTAFRKGLSETGFVEGQNVAIEFRWAQNNNDRLPELAADLIRRRVAVIAAPGTVVTALAAKAATTSIPIVFATGGDPVQIGLVASLNRPGGNVTGVTTMSAELMPKRLGLLHELLPRASRLAVLINPRSPIVAEAMVTDMRAAAAATGQQIEVVTATSNREIDLAFASLKQKRADAFLISLDTLFRDRRVQIVTLAAHQQLPAIYFDREFAEIGGLMSYGSSTTELYRQAGIYTGRVIKGDKPADMPVLRATKFELVINIQTAKALGLEIPPTLLARADEVIE